MRTVVVTGFGPFLEHTVNSSWEAVKLLPDLNTEEQLNIRLIVQEIPVSYESVNDVVPKIWEIYKPDLVVHCGVSSSATSIVLESTANKTGYFMIDNDDKQLENGICVLGCEDKLKTELDLDQIVKNAKLFSVNLELSNNARKYLCEYIYYVSLSINKQRTAFLHVPALSETYTSERVAKEIKIIIRLLLEQLDNVHYLGEYCVLTDTSESDGQNKENVAAYDYTSYNSDVDSDDSGDGKLVIVENPDEIPDETQ